MNKLPILTLCALYGLLTMNTVLGGFEPVKPVVARQPTTPVFRPPNIVKPRDGAATTTEPARTDFTTPAEKPKEDNSIDPSDLGDAANSTSAAIGVIGAAIARSSASVDNNLVSPGIILLISLFGYVAVY